MTAIFALEKDSGCLKVKRQRICGAFGVGDWRVGYEIDDAAQEVTIVAIAHRREFYE